jgi:transposase
MRFGKVHVVVCKCDPETRAKAIRLVLEHRDDYQSEWAAITAVSQAFGMSANTLRNWIRQQHVDDGARGGISSAAGEIRALKRRNATTIWTDVARGRGPRRLPFIHRQ